ncbi:hypothetical protein GF373_12695 [bacterium]|nr:hypothetical protein [bacterium]
MEPLGWLIFIVSNLFVIGLVSFCFYRVLSLSEEHMHSPLDIDTKDLNENGEEEEDFSLDKE